MNGTRLSLLTFPNRWDGGAIAINVLALPIGDPLAPLAPGEPAFADATLALEAQLIPSLDRLPAFADVTATIPLALTPPPPTPRAVFGLLQLSVPIVPPTPATATPRRPGRAIKKLLMPSYQRAVDFAPPKTPFAVTDDSYECALNCATEPPPPGAPRPVNDWTWGRVIALALRQPRLAQRLGLLYELTVAPPSADFYQDGGWLFVTIAPGSAYAALAGTPAVQTYAARLPALATPRPLFGRVLFPILSSPPVLSYDEVVAEAEAYDDGFSRVVHASQPFSRNVFAREEDETLPTHEFGIRLGWDDEDALIALNRQITTDPSLADLNAPLGVARYRVDVRRHGTAAWFSLNRVKGELKTAAIDLGLFDGELGVEVAPIQPQGLRDGDYWLPTYFTQWTGRSVVALDPDERELGGKPAATGGLQPVADDLVPLRYGESYDFRVRLVDIAGGGPAAGDVAVNHAPAPVATVPFRRFVPPGPVRLDPEPGPVDPLAPPASYTVHRPRLGYPELVYTGRPNAVADLKADRAAAGVAGRPIGLPDPDVAELAITVEVRGPELDAGNDSPSAGPYRVLYRTTRPFPADPSQPLILDVAFEDVPTLTAFPTPAAGPLALPSGRDLRLRLAPVCREDAALAYFGVAAARFGRAIAVATRKESGDERDLLVEDTSGPLLRGIFLLPDPYPSNQVLAQQALAGAGDGAPTDALGLLAQELQLEVNDLSFTARPGERIAFGCAYGLRHTLSPDHAKLTFGARIDLTGRWLVAVAARMRRDWTWDMLRDASFSVERTLERDGVPPVTEDAGTLELRRTVSATTQTRPQRDFTRLLFVDAIDGQPAGAAFPRPIRATYTLKPAFTNPPAQADAPAAITLELPVTAPPRQVPRIVAAGIALSPYRRTAAYDATESRRRALWIEFEEAPEDPHDVYFCRVLAASPDPMLLANREPVGDPLEPPLPLPTEAIRVIVPAASDDSAGLGAMQRFIPGDGDRHYLVPLPPGVEQDAAALFGFFTYEFRLGHAVDWSTAHGRFGRPLRVTGVQHPAPSLTCAAQRLGLGVIASAPYALPVYEGVSRLPSPPNTELWMVLYAQVAQADGQDHRNVLLGQRRAVPPRRNRPDDRFTVGRGEFSERGALPRGGYMLGEVGWSQAEIRAALAALCLDADAPLSVLAVELLPEEQRPPDPLGAQLGQVRILRTSPLVPVGTICEPCVTA
jgi:hypothetical protein